MNLTKLIIATISAMSLLPPDTYSKPNAEVSSPDKKIMVRFDLNEGNATYSVFFAGKQILAPSKLGIVREDEDFSTKLTLESASNVETVTDNYTLGYGKKLNCSYTGNKRIFHVKSASGQKMDIIFQVSNDGVAFRYYFPDQSTEIKKIKQEISSFHFYKTTKAWLQHCPDAKTGWEHSQPSYEENYDMGIAVGTPAPFQAGWVFPALFNYEKYWFVVSETGLGRDYCASRLSQQSPDGEYSINFPQPTENYTNGVVYPESKLPWYSPWRIIALGDNLATIAESTLGTDLAIPAKYDASAYLKPGHASWSWVIMKDNATIYSVQKEFIDYAADMKWQYCLIDADWDTQIGYDKIKELADYAKTKNVGLILWYNSAGDWNTTPYHPRNMMLTKESRTREFQILKAFGIKGVKVDFFGADGQSMIDYYQDILEDAAKFGILVNFHGCTLPRGWQRTYPNLVNMEAIKGYEFLTFEQKNADLEASHSCMMPFTRNIFETMDFTPTCFSGIPRIHRVTTNAFELALSVLFIAGIQHFAEIPSGMAKVPVYVKTFMQELPTTWEDVKFIDGYPGKLVIIARKSGNNWYVAGINGENVEKTVSIKLPFLAGNQSGQLITDGADSASFENKTITLSPKQSVELKIKGNGGFVIKL
ncbi:MAG TPA: glycoside hydrolase family 97 catalytic domain-containing protein [Bacteroidales bacterium]